MTWARMLYLFAGRDRRHEQQRQTGKEAELRKLVIVTALMAAVVFMSVIGLVFFSTAGEEEAGASSPQFYLEGEEFNLGDIPADRTVERVISFQNPGQAPLKVSIDKVRPAPEAACGCGVEGYEVRPATVEPGGIGELVFKLRVPQGMPPMDDVMVAQLSTNDPRRPGLTISLRFTMSE